MKTNAGALRTGAGVFADSPKKLRNFLFAGLFAGQILAANGKDGPDATANHEPSDAPVVFSPELQEVASHLDTRGAHFSITNIEGDLDDICALADGILDASAADTALGMAIRYSFPYLLSRNRKISEDFLFRQVLAQSGLGAITAKGSSAIRAGDHWHSRLYFATGGKRKALLSVFGGDGTRFAGPSFAPPDTDLLFEVHLNLKQITPFLRSVARSFDNDIGKHLEEISALRAEPGTMSLGDAMGKFDARISLAATLDTETTWTWPRVFGGAELPGLDFVLRVDGAMWLWEEYAAQVEFNSDVREDGGIKYLSCNGPVSSPMEKVHLFFAIDKARDRIWFSTGANSIAAAIGDGPKLAGTRCFQSGIDRLPGEGNLLFYAGPKLTDKLIALQERNLALFSEKNAILQESIQDVFTEFRRGHDARTGYSLAVANQDNGILIACNSARPDKGSAIFRLLSVVAMPASYLQISRWREGSCRAGCIMNIRNIQQAVRSYQGMNGLRIGVPFSPSDIVGPGKFIEKMPTCPLDGSPYIWSKTIPKVGELAAKCPHAHDGGHVPQSHDDW
jgi:hypothetical protein